ncbi:Uncharacterized conserved protein, contains PCI domain [Phaffia rhodozyma]|uniref:Uncharacterized conserved protein, contains PCI domain n=1 Tax=Phaffia rhodozyma TaxID=264483 RepID=A0A0F7SXS7_PHARH|nr:Uncharacterized conserved protein, contains PCI domain [Phaffia rhodozyma]
MVKPAFAQASNSNLDSQSPERKAKFLALASLCSASSSGVVTYAEIAKVLSVEESEVESWIIDAIRLNILSAKLSQPSKTVRVQRAYLEEFGSNDWKSLQQKLAAWDENLASVSEVVSEARRIGDTLEAPKSQVSA